MYTSGLKTFLLGVTMSALRPRGKSPRGLSPLWTDGCAAYSGAVKDYATFYWAAASAGG